MTTTFLQKGQHFNITKRNPGLSTILVGLGWDPVESKHGGKLLNTLFGTSGGMNIDCDASVFMLGEGDRFEDSSDVIYFGNLKSENGSIQHTGDNLTGNGRGDDEQIYIDLQRIPSHIQKLVFVVNIYDCVKRKQHFGMIRNAYIRIINPENESVLAFYNLSENYSGKTCLIVAEIHRQNDEWEFAAIGKGINATDLRDVVRFFL